MDIKKIKVGMYVVIANDISTTHAHYSSCSKMHEMKGRCFKVNDLLQNSVIVHGFRWHPDDIIEEIKPIKKYEHPFHFDSSLL